MLIVSSCIEELFVAPVVSSICLSDWAPAWKWTVWRLMSPLGKITTHFDPVRGELRTNRQEHSERMKGNIILLLFCTSCNIFSFILSAVCFYGWHCPLQMSSNKFHTWKQSYSATLTHVCLKQAVDTLRCSVSQVSLSAVRAAWRPVVTQKDVLTSECEWCGLSLRSSLTDTSEKQLFHWTRPADEHPVNM